MSRRTFGAVLVLLLTPVIASAGPIGWTYGVQTSALDGSHVYFGTEYQTTVDPVTGTEVRTPYLMVGNIDRWATGSGTGSQTLRLGSFGPNDLAPFPTNDPWAITRPGSYELQVTLTDTVSNESATLNYFVQGFSDGYFQTGTGVVTLSLEDRTDTLVLGGNRYTVHPTVSNSESAASLDLQVGVTSATPEPGAFALAGFGLATCGVWRRRRSIPSNPVV